MRIMILVTILLFVFYQAKSQSDSISTSKICGFGLSSINSLATPFPFFDLTPDVVPNFYYQKEKHSFSCGILIGKRRAFERNPLSERVYLKSIFINGTALSYQYRLSKSFWLEYLFIYKYYQGVFPGYFGDFYYTANFLQQTIGYSVKLKIVENLYFTHKLGGGINNGYTSTKYLKIKQGEPPPEDNVQTSILSVGAVLSVGLKIKIYEREK